MRTRRAQSKSPPRIYPSAIVMDGATLGSDVVIGAFCFIAGGAMVGRGTRVQSHTSIWNGVELGEDVFVGPGAMFTNVRRPRAAFPQSPNWDHTIVERGASIGAHATLVAPVRVGEFAMIGAGAVVANDVPAHAVVAGVPAVVTGWICECGETIVREKERPEKFACACEHAT